jgi:hypothetical protein
MPLTGLIGASYTELGFRQRDLWREPKFLYNLWDLHIWKVMPLGAMQSRPCFQGPKLAGKTRIPTPAQAD